MRVYYAMLDVCQAATLAVYAAAAIFTPLILRLVSLLDAGFTLPLYAAALILFISPRRHIFATLISMPLLCRCCRATFSPALQYICRHKEITTLRFSCRLPFRHCRY